MKERPLKGLCPRGESGLCLAVRWATAWAHSDRIPGKMTGRGKRPLAPEHVPGRVSSARVFFTTISPGMGKDLSGVHRNMSIGICFMHSHTYAYVCIA